MKSVTSVYRWVCADNKRCNYDPNAVIMCDVGKNRTLESCCQAWGSRDRSVFTPADKASSWNRHIFLKPRSVTFLEPLHKTVFIIPSCQLIKPFLGAILHTFITFSFSWNQARIKSAVHKVNTTCTLMTFLYYYCGLE